MSRTHNRCAKHYITTFCKLPENNIKQPINQTIHQQEKTQTWHKMCYDIYTTNSRLQNFIIVTVLGYIHNPPLSSLSCLLVCIVILIFFCLFVHIYLLCLSETAFWFIASTICRPTTLLWNISKQFKMLSTDNRVLLYCVRDRNVFKGYEFFCETW